ncbi:subtilisin-like protein [Lactarius quietus]|nr:subtilisin-like protein [Lactarius quietus]
MRYHQFSVISVLASVPLANFVNPLTHWGEMHIKHTWTTVPSNWETLGHPPAVTTTDLHFALKSRQENALIDALYEVSDPRSLKHVLSHTYGAYLTKEQVAQLVAPHPDTLQLINSWLEHHHIPPSAVSMTHGGSWLTVTGVPVSRANQMLGASYQLYRRSGTNDTTILRTIGYALPAMLHKHVRTVVPTTYFTSTRTLRKSSRRHSVRAAAHTEARELAEVRSSSDDEEDEEVDPSELRSLYKTVGYVPAATDKNSLGVTGFSKHYPSRTDLNMFMRMSRTDAKGTIFEVVQVNGGEFDPTNPSLEANQNIQYTEAISYPTPVTFYSNGGVMKLMPGTNQPDTGDAYQAWLNYMIRLDTVPQTISSSYGDPEENVPLEYAKALCDLYAQLGARGASILVPSGNDGVGDGDCIANKKTGKVQFIPEFPSTCPWVTSVGGTMQGPIDDPEVAAELSGGGFSNFFPRPIYQDPAVPKFLERFGRDKYDGLYNRAGRGIPDIAAQALNYFVIVEDEPAKIDGTSCATSTVAGIISLLNDYKLSIGKKPLGFLNPWLYGLAVVGMNDITSGSNPGCGTEGFSAIPGWDPVTGLGTPDFLNLQGIIEYMNQFQQPTSQLPQSTSQFPLPTF